MFTTWESVPPRLVKFAVRNILLFLPPLPVLLKGGGWGVSLWIGAPFLGMGWCLAIGHGQELFGGEQFGVRRFSGLSAIVFSYF